ncbi:hypothetical protein J5H75_18790 [Pseudomonas asiatica]|uniref:hypothetical protein n=1 Tax=Pseudomonas asiatica TaxID=2219225 RepID=UPI001AAF5734|nr:hypothetical protein [Pseudomonas asiatica]MBO2923728.1 hypothetical protein [Pseudomonas asiatica]
MAGKDIEKALMAVEPVTKAAKIRQVMPVIEKQLRAGVRRQAILDVLKEQGIEVSMDTLKSYLYRYRKAQRGKQATTANPEPVSQHIDEPARQIEPEIEGGVSYDTEPSHDAEERPHVGPAELSRLMNPGDDKNASDLDRYESAARSRRKRT